MLVRNALPLLTVAIVKFILPLARLERIALGMRGRLRLVMKCLREPVGTSRSRSSSRREKNEKRGEDDQNSRAFPHHRASRPEIRGLLAWQTAEPTRSTHVQVIDQIEARFATENKELRSSRSPRRSSPVTFR